MCAKTEKENLFEVKLLPLVLKQTNRKKKKAAAAITILYVIIILL